LPWAISFFLKIETLTPWEFQAMGQALVGLWELRGILGVSPLPYGPMQEINPRPFRTKRVLLTSLALTAVTLLILPPVYHHFMIWVNHGTWCAQVSPDGMTRLKYGSEACGL
jgi:hypothetical protein